MDPRSLRAFVGIVNGNLPSRLRLNCENRCYYYAWRKICADLVNRRTALAAGLRLGWRHAPDL